MPAGIRIPIDVDDSEAQKKLKAFGKSIDQNLVVAIGAGVAAFGAMSAAWIAVLDRMDEIAPVAASFEKLTETLEDVDAPLQAMRVATLGLIGDFDLMKVTNNAMILGVVKSQDEFAQMARDAVLLGKALGVDALDAINSIVTGIGRQSKLMLDNLGILIDVRKANIDYAASIGKAESELTDLERTLSFQKAALDALTVAAESVRDATISMGTAWKAAKTIVGNLADAVVLGISDMEFMKTTMADLEEGTTFWGEATDSARFATTLLGNILTLNTSAAIAQFTDEVEDSTVAIKALTDEEKIAIQEANALEQRHQDLIAAFNEEAAALPGVEVAFFNLTNAIGEAEIGLGDFTEEFTFVAPAIEPAQAALENFILTALSLGEMEIELPEFTMPNPEDIPDVRSFGEKLVGFFNDEGVGSAVGIGIARGIGEMLSSGDAIEAISEGLKTGLTALAALVPGWGSVLAIFVTPLVDLISNLLGDAFKKANALDHVREQFGVALGEALAGAMDDLVASGIVGDLDAAFRLLMVDAIKAASITSQAELNDWVTMVHQILSSVDEGMLTTEQAIKAMSDAWLALIPSLVSVGGSVMVFQDQWSDLITRFGTSGPHIDAIRDALIAMQAAGVAGISDIVDWLATMGVDLSDIMAATEDVAKTWQDAMAAMGVDVAETTAQVTQDQIDAIKALGLSAETEAALIKALKKEQRDAEIQAGKDFKKDLRDRAKELGLNRKQTRELIRATIREQRRDERKADRDAKRDAKDKEDALIAAAENTRDGILATFAGVSVDIPISLVAGSSSQQQQIVNAFAQSIINKIQNSGAF